MARSIAVLTTSRADYGIVKWIASDLDKSPDFQMHLLVTGPHVVESLGHTITEILSDEEIPPIVIPYNLRSDSRIELATACGGLVGQVAKFVMEKTIDLLLVVGDRAETLACCLGAYFADVPVGHIHGGELTFGSTDDSMRHAITKLSSVHFAAAAEYARRIVRLGENPEYVFVVGTPGLDSIGRYGILERSEVLEALGIQEETEYALLTFHTFNLSEVETEEVLRCSLDEIERLFEGVLVVTGTNSDPGSEGIRNFLNGRIESQPEKYRYFENLGHDVYVSALAHSAFVAGNSSSGIIEAPTLRTPTVNIGSRQDGRIRSESVFDSDGTAESTRTALTGALAWRDRSDGSKLTPAYGDVGASKRIVEILTRISFPKPSSKRWFESETIQDFNLELSKQ